MTINGLSRRRKRREPPATTSAATNFAAQKTVTVVSMHRMSSDDILPSLMQRAMLSITIALCTLIATSSAFSVPSSSSSLPASPPPPFPNPSTPEETVQNQLHYYQTSQLSRAFYECCSPGNQAATNDSLKEFERLIKEPPYDLILEHERADVLLEVRPNDNGRMLGGLSSSGDEDEEEDKPRDELGNEILDVACILVCIRPNEKARRSYPVWFWWEMSKQYVDIETSQNDQAGEEDDETMWRVDCVIPDFEDLDFETESLSIEDFGDDDGDEDELTIYWDMDS